MRGAKWEESACAAVQCTVTVGGTTYIHLVLLSTVQSSAVQCSVRCSQVWHKVCFTDTTSVQFSAEQCSAFHRSTVH